MTEIRESIVVSLRRSALNRLYAIAYSDGHHATVEGNYTDVLPCDWDIYFDNEVGDFLGERDE